MNIKNALPNVKLLSEMMEGDPFSFVDPNKTGVYIRTTLSSDDGISVVDLRFGTVINFLDQHVFPLENASFVLRSLFHSEPRNISEVSWIDIEDYDGLVVEWLEDVVGSIWKSRKIACIKEIRSMWCVGLKEAKVYCDGLFARNV